MALTKATDKIIANADGNLNLSGIVTASSFSGPLVPSGDFNVGSNIKLGTASGIVTATTINATTGTFSGNLGVGGVLTYEDVSNIDSVGVVTARSGIKIGPTAGVAGTFFADGSYVTAGIITATSFSGSGANLTSLPAQATLSNNGNDRIITGGSGVNLNGEANLTFANSGSDPILTVTNSGHAQLTLTSTSGSDHCGVNFGDSSDHNAGMIQYTNNGDYMVFHTAGSERLRIRSDGKLGINTTTTNDSSELLCLMGPSGDNATIGIKCNSTTHAGILSFHDTAGTFRGRVQYSHNTDHMQFNTAGSERLRIGSSGQIGVAGANFGTARQTIVSGGASGAVSWSSNPFLLDMDSLGDIDYDGVFLRYRETADVTGNGLVYLGLCKSTTNCTPGRIGIPVGFIPGVTYNSHFRVDKVGITPWPDGSGHRYEFYAIISDWASTGKLGIFYLTNSTN